MLIGLQDCSWEGGQAPGIVGIFASLVSFYFGQVWIEICLDGDVQTDDCLFHPYFIINFLSTKIKLTMVPTLRSRRNAY